MAFSNGLFNRKLLKNTQHHSILSIVAILSLFCISSTLCLYQDQVGKFDWRKQFIGIPKFVYYLEGVENILVATQSNVISSIHVRDGSIIWRQLLPDGCHLNHMSVLKSSETDPSDYLVKTICVAGTPTAANQTNIWNPQNGLLVSDARFRDFLEDNQAESQLADAGHVVDGSRAFSLDEDSSLLVQADGSVTYQAHGKNIWTREESLASVVAVEIVKLPVDMRDKFGLKKTIVLLTKTGKLFGVDTFTGQINWQSFIKELATQETEINHIRLFTTRQSDEEANESNAIVIHPKGTIVTFNPITGELVDKTKLPNAIKQIAQTRLDEETNSRGVIILDIKNNVRVFPEGMFDQVRADLDKYYLTVAETNPPSLVGYKFELESSAIKPVETWFFPINSTERIVNLSIKRMDEEIHSPARVLGDRGILYKYVNPNLIAIMTEGSSGDPCSQEQSINIYFVDAVTGALVHNIYHPKSRGPSQMVLSENWLVYSYFNIKSRRTEVSSLEMFEGTQQVNSTAFSSLSRSHIKPALIEHKSFIFPSGISAMVDTVTLRGMTNRHIIVGLPSGGLLEIPKIYLDPRRPINMLAEHREEGLIPYMPELPIPSESLLNYDQTLMAVRRIVTSPAILESTSLVFAYGLDHFFTRVTPSKTFDILKDDFDHVLISAVLVFLVVASLVSKYLAQRKALHAAWK